jgi:hypothetical protein
VIVLGAFGATRLLGDVSLPSESGVVVAVQSASATEVTGFTLRTRDGRVLQFAIGRLDTVAPAFPAVHLREHLVTLVPVRVWYEQAGDRRVARRLVDAPQASKIPASPAEADPLPSAQRPLIGLQNGTAYTITPSHGFREVRVAEPSKGVSVCTRTRS